MIPGGRAGTTEHTAVIRADHCLGGARRKPMAGPSGGRGSRWPTSSFTGKETEAGDGAAWTKAPERGRGRGSPGS